MNVSPAASGGNFLQPAKQGSPTDKIVCNLEKQKTRLQNEIKKVDGGKDDLETKRRKKEELQKQIEELAKQISQMQLEKLKERPEIKEPPGTTTAAAEQDTGAELTGGTPLAESKHFIGVLSKHSQMKTLGKVRTEAMGKARIAIAQGADPSEAMATVNSLDNKIYEKTGEIQKELTKAREEMDAKQAKQKEAWEKIRKENSSPENNLTDAANRLVIDETGKTENTDNSKEAPPAGRSEISHYQKTTNDSRQKPNNINIEL